MIWRSGLLALAVSVAGVGAAFSHALPGSVLMLREQNATLELTIQFPVEDLLVAAPELAALAEVPPGEPVPRSLLRALSRYLGGHLAVTADDARLDLTMTGARVQFAYHDHLGHFALIISQWQMATAGGLPASLVLTYDAVMHEVRNHRATVHWTGQNGASHQVAEFGFFSAEDGVAIFPHEAAQ